MDIVMAGVGALLVLALLVVLKRKQIEDPGLLDDDEGDVGWAVVEEDADGESLPADDASDIDASDEPAAVQDFTEPDSTEIETAASDVEDEDGVSEPDESAVELSPDEAPVDDEAEDEPAEEAAEPGSALGRFLSGLKRSRDAFTEGLSRFFQSTEIDEAALEALEDTLVGSDIGVRAAMEITEKVRSAAQEGDAPEIKSLLRSELLQRLGESKPLVVDGDGPQAILVVGVNGSGKTTTIGKLAARYRSEGKSVLLAAGDTFRAGAIEQLKVWGERSDVPVIAHQEGGDPAAVIFDALQAAQARGVDLVICDTAGRLQAQQALMDELAKVVRVMGKAMPGAPHEVLLVLDSTIGQNAVSQARSFKEVVGVTGIALTKLDGTARGGVVVAICDELDVPVKLIGLGEGIDDLRDFESEPFVDALLGQ
jgi:fused signal recognition particle receptor